MYWRNGRPHRYRSVGTTTRTGGAEKGVGRPCPLSNGTPVLYGKESFEYAIEADSLVDSIGIYDRAPVNSYLIRISYIVAVDVRRQLCACWLFGERGYRGWNSGVEAASHG